MLFAIYPIVFLYSYNINQVTISQLVLPLGLSAMMSFIIWMCMGRLTKDLYKAGLITTMFCGLFYGYGYLYNVLENTKFYYAKHIYLIPFVILLWGYGSFFISLIKRVEVLRSLNKILNIIALVLVSINVLSIVAFEVQGVITSNTNNYQEQETLIDSTSSNNNLPDIYFILPDEYASIDTINEIYGYDNHEFVSFLEETGFYIANNSQSKYPSTILSLSSILNMDYIDDVADPTSLITNSPVQTFLEEKGYKTYWFGNRYYINRFNIEADKYFNFFEEESTYYVDEFHMFVLNSTILNPFHELLSHEKYDRDSHRASVQYKKDNFLAVLDIEEPKFVLLHFLIPHDPFIFGENGEVIDYENQYNWADKEYYLGQFKYTSKVMQELITHILEKQNKRDSIIIVLSDHGPRGGIKRDITIPTVHHHKVFSAFYFPNEGDSMLYDDITPTNVFRVLFNQYFGSEFELLEDFDYEKNK